LDFGFSILDLRRQVTTQAEMSCGTKISCSSDVPSSNVNVQRGHGDVVKLAMRFAPSGCVTSGR
jgi:hypothetical protein